MQLCFLLLLSLFHLLVTCSGFRSSMQRHVSGAFVQRIAAANTQRDTETDTETDRHTDTHRDRHKERHREAVVVTGLGVISPCSSSSSSSDGSAESFFQSLCKGTSGIGELQRFDSTPFKCKVAGEVKKKDFRPLDFYRVAKRERENDLSVHFAVAATHLALHDAGIAIGACNVDWNRVGVVIGCGLGGVTAFEEAALNMREKGARAVSPYTIPKILGNFPCAVVSMEIGARGPSSAVQTACASATYSIGEALRILQLGNADIVVCGGTEAPLTPLVFAGFQNLGVLSTAYNDKPTTASRPFDLTRDGFVMSEGSGILVLETLSHAVKRNAKVYCEVAGFGSSSDAFHITSPSPSGSAMTMAIQMCLRDSHLAINEVQHINMHGTSTRKNDYLETVSIKNCFGSHASKIKLNSIKGCTGHSLGAAGSFEAISCVKSVETGVIPPTANLVMPDPECDLDYTPIKPVSLDNLGVALSCSSGFGGHNGVLSFKSCLP